MRVLFVTTAALESASVRYRCAHMAEALRLRGIEAEIVTLKDGVPVRVQHDVVVLHRVHWAGGGWRSKGIGANRERIAAAARAVGAAVVYSTDDLVFETEYAYHVGLQFPDDPGRYSFHRWECADALRALSSADAAIVSTEFLAARARRAAPDKPVVVVRNFLGEEIEHQSAAARMSRAAMPPRAPDRVILGYLSGSPTHDADFAEISPFVAATLETFPGARLLVVGPVTLPRALEPWRDAGRILRHPFVPWRDLPGLIATVDINLAPLDPMRAFNHAKSEVKFLEAAVVGIPTVAGCAAGFVEGVLGGEDCVLVESVEDWGAALAGLIEHPERRRTIGDAALASATSRALATAWADRVADVFQQFAALPVRPTAVASSVVVRDGLAERVERRLRALEAALVGRRLRWERHLRLLKGELNS